MIIGTFINGYKSYAKSIFAPIANNNDQKYAVYIGANGVGKSGILEALDVFSMGVSGMLQEVLLAKIDISPRSFLLRRKDF